MSGLKIEHAKGSIITQHTVNCIKGASTCMRCGNKWIEKEGCNPKCHACEFDEWYTSLKLLMLKKLCNEGCQTDPEDWCDKEKWKDNFTKGLTIHEAYLAEC